jgi:diaminohydroxyphosphoribosylaminopyrimidine deaminase/5-amino-6-(5-phosphoribosylamino)uracil reductase
MPENRSLIKQSANDIHFMSIALQLADNAKGSTFPNPSVGAVIAKNGHVVATGTTSGYGGPHAEINALKKAGAGSKDATMYVTLEPCCHVGRTGPCTDAIILSGIKRMHVSIADPNPLVRGKGIRLLRKNGIEVAVGLLQKDAARINEDFFFWITRKRPWVSVKLAMTLDGRIADVKGSSKWITSVEARRYAHDIRRRHAAVAVGAVTLAKDDPKLTVRFGKQGNPVRFVFSSKESVPSASYFAASVDPARHPGAKGLRSVLVVPGGLRSKSKRTNGIEVWRTGEIDRHTSTKVFLSMAQEEEICSVLVEGGRKLVSCFLETRLVNRLYLFYGNKIIGNGIAGMEFTRGLPISRPAILDEMELRRFGDDLMISGILNWR